MGGGCLHPSSTVAPSHPARLGLQQGGRRCGADRSPWCMPPAAAGRRAAPQSVVHRGSELFTSSSGVVCWLACVGQGGAPHHAIPFCCAAPQAVEEFVKSGDVVVLAYVEKNTTDEYKTFAAVADQLRSGAFWRPYWARGWAWLGKMLSANASAIR